MPPRKKVKTNSSSTNSPLKVNARGEVLQIRSPAEFFAENQNIAGFDNPGKSMYTTIRELVENSLDAAETIGRLPNISLSITEMDAKQFNESRGLKVHTRIDHDLYTKSTKKKRKSITGSISNVSTPTPSRSSTPTSNDTTFEFEANTKDKKENKIEIETMKNSTDKKISNRRNDVYYYKIVCKDNGVGMMHDKIPDMLGRVLAGSKYGVRQTRGKFGLGAKMALIWSKKSTGMPIEIRSGYSRNANDIPTRISYCKLDIDIYKNEPNIHIHTKSINEDDWIGTEITLTISGNWTTYKSRIHQYLQQLAIITPYAAFELNYICLFNEKRNISIQYERRSNQMPDLAKEVKHHPSALNDLLLKQLIDNSKQTTLCSFLIKDLSNIDSTLAKRLINEIGSPFEEVMNIKSLSLKQIHQLVEFFRQVEFKSPDGKHLSPAGEYNLRLGIMKELDPEMVATHTESTAVFEGHAFIVEAGVSIGGKNVKEGINVYRFANRIPLLFEAGGDVVTRTAMKQINWGSYKIDHKRDRIGVFVSIVSTKIPFKGTGKEYIGDDIQEMKKAVKRVLQVCCQQLRNKLLKKNRLKENAQRKKNLTKYIPDAARSIYGLLKQLKDRYEVNDKDETIPVKKQTLMKAIDTKEITEKILNERLYQAVQEADENATQEELSMNGRNKTNEKKIFILPLNENKRSMTPTFTHPVSMFKFYSNIFVSSIPKNT